MILGKSVQKNFDEDNGAQPTKKIEVKPSTAFKNAESSDDDFDFDDVEDEDVKKLDPVAKAAPVKREVFGFDKDEKEYKPTNIQPSKPSAAFENNQSSNDDSDNSDEDEKDKKKPASGSFLFVFNYR